MKLNNIRYETETKTKKKRKKTEKQEKNKQNKKKCKLKINTQTGQENKNALGGMEMPQLRCVHFQALRNTKKDAFNCKTYIRTSK